MDEVEVQVLQLQVLQGLQQRRLHVLWVMLGVPQLGRDEHVLSSQGLVSRQREDMKRESLGFMNEGKNRLEVETI